MARAVIRLASERTRQTASDWAWNADEGTLVTFASPDQRTSVQNAAMWAMLTDIAEQVEWDGQWLTPDDWKLLFMAELPREARMVKMISGRGYLNMNTSSSALRVAEFARLLDIISSFAAESGVRFRVPPG